MFKVNNKDTRTTPGIFIVNFQHIFTPCSSVPIAKFEHEIAGWENALHRVYHERSNIAVSFTEHLIFPEKKTYTCTLVKY